MADISEFVPKPILSSHIGVPTLTVMRDEAGESKETAERGSGRRMQMLGCIYKHYKGELYKVLDVVPHADSDTLEQNVYYECLYANKVSRTWTRSLKSFTETLAVDGKQVPRFQLVTDTGDVSVK